MEFSLKIGLLSFFFFFFLRSRTMGCFSGRLMSTASDQKLFYKLCSPFCCSFDELVEEKVISLSYSSAILTPPWDILNNNLNREIFFLHIYLITLCCLVWEFFLVICGFEIYDSQLKHTNLKVSQLSYEGGTVTKVNHVPHSILCTAYSSVKWSHYFKSYCERNLRKNKLCVVVVKNKLLLISQKIAKIFTLCAWIISGELIILFCTRKNIC